MTAAAAIRNALREPLVHFLLAGSALFLFASWRGEPVDPASRTIEIDAARVGLLVQRFTQTWQRPPSPAELDGLIRDDIKEEVYYREALRMGLEADDAIIRRRLRAKMEELATAQAENAVADDATLQRWLDSQTARYAQGSRFSFDQIYLGNDAVQSKAIANYIKKQLTTADAANWKRQGLPISLRASVDNENRANITREFGESFAEALPDMQVGEWTGPVASGFGQHIVRVRAVVKGKAPILSEVRQRVENDWRAETAKAREAAAYQALLDGYTITIAKP